jgi:hypothetical protein
VLVLGKNESTTTIYKVDTPHKGPNSQPPHTHVRTQHVTWYMHAKHTHMGVLPTRAYPTCRHQFYPPCHFYDSYGDAWTVTAYLACEASPRFTSLVRSTRLSSYEGHFHYGVLGLYFYPRCTYHSRSHRTPSPRRHSVGQMQRTTHKKENPNPFPKCLKMS